MLVTRVQTRMTRMEDVTRACRAVSDPPGAAAATEPFPYAGRGWWRSPPGGSCCRSSGQSTSGSLGSWSRRRSPLSTKETQVIDSASDCDVRLWAHVLLYLAQLILKLKNWFWQRWHDVNWSEQRESLSAPHQGHTESESVTRPTAQSRNVLTLSGVWGLVLQVINSDRQDWWILPYHKCAVQPAAWQLLSRDDRCPYIWFSER